METIINKVAESGIITLNLEDLLPTDAMVFDLKAFLFMELILKEKNYRESLLAHDWLQYAQKDVILTCSVDAIIPVWAYMLAAQYLQPVAKRIRMGTVKQANKDLLLVTIPDEAYAMITFKLRPVAKSIMYGEPCSTVPIYKQKKG